MKSSPFLAVHAIALETHFVAPFAWRWLALAAALADAGRDPTQRPAGDLDPAAHRH